MVALATYSQGEGHRGVRTSPGQGPNREATMIRKTVRCYCGYAAEGEDDELVTAVQTHVRDVHRMEYTREEVLAIAEPLN